MMTLSLLAVAMLRQNPRSADVALPPGWHVEYFRKGDSRDAALLGPMGQEIRFPAYGEGVEEASSVRAREPKSTYVMAFLGGRPVEAVLTRAGGLTVSTGWRRPHEHASDAPIHFFTRVTSAREAAVALGIVLSYLRAADRDPIRTQRPTRSADLPAPKRTVPGDPLAVSLSLPEGYRYRQTSYGNVPKATLVSPKGPPIEMRSVMPLGPGSRPVPRGDRAEWEEEAALLDGTLTVHGDSVAGLSVWFHRPSGGAARGSIPMFTTKAQTPQSALIMIFAALSYTP